MKKISCIFVTVVCLPSIICAAERKESRGKEIPSTPMPPRVHRSSQSNPQSPKTPTSGRNSPKLSGRPSSALTSSDTPKTPGKKVKSIKELQEELKKSQELRGSGEVKK
jgi:hypothetical protein